MKCANCNNPAVYVYRITADKFTPYCEKDLPLFLDGRRKAGLLETTEEHKAIVVEGTKELISETSIPVVEEPVVEPPKPVKKVSKKQAK